MTTESKILALFPEYKRPKSLSDVDFVEFIAQILGYQFVTGCMREGEKILLTGVADKEEVEILKKHLNIYFTGLNIYFKFRPRPMCYYISQEGDSWQSLSKKFYGSEMFELELFNENHTVYTAYDKLPKLQEPLPLQEYIYVPKIDTLN